MFSHQLQSIARYKSKTKKELKGNPNALESELPVYFLCWEISILLINFLKEAPYLVPYFPTIPTFFVRFAMTPSAEKMNLWPITVISYSLSTTNYMKLHLLNQTLRFWLNLQLHIYRPTITRSLQNVQKEYFYDEKQHWRNYWCYTKFAQKSP